MVIMSNPYKEDKELEEVLSGNRYGKHIAWTMSTEPQYVRKTSEEPEIIIGNAEKPLTQISIHENDELFETMINKIVELEREVESLKEIQAQNHYDNLIEQNEISRKELEEVFDIDPNDTIDTKILDSVLDDLIDPNENSSELVRSVRDNP